MTKAQNDQPAWLSPVIHIGMVMTILSVIAAQFVTNQPLKLALIGIALLGIVLSMAPFWPKSAAAFWQSLRRMYKDANKDDHLDL